MDVSIKIHAAAANGMILVEALRDGRRIDSHFAMSMNDAWALSRYFQRTYNKKTRKPR